MNPWCLIVFVLLSLDAVAGDIYRWTDPETGELITSPVLPNYPIKEARVNGSLPGGSLVNVDLDMNSPEVKAAIERRKAQEVIKDNERKRIAAEQKRIADEQKRAYEAEQAEQKRIAEAKEIEKKRIADIEEAEKKRIAEAEKAERKRIAEIQAIELGKIDAAKAAAAKEEAGKKYRIATSGETSQCIESVKRSHSFKDPDSIKIEGDAYATTYPSGKKEILLKLNGKNSYGAYAGADIYRCRYGTDGTLFDAL